MTDPNEPPVPAETAGDERVVDVRRAVHEAGHEVEELGWADVPDTAPAQVERRDGEDGEQITREVEEMGSD